MHEETNISQHTWHHCKFGNILFREILTNITECSPLKMRKQKKKPKGALLSVSVQITERQMTKSRKRPKLRPKWPHVSFKVKGSHLTSVWAALYPCNNPKLRLLRWAHKTVMSFRHFHRMLRRLLSIFMRGNIRPVQVSCGTLLKLGRTSISHHKQLAFYSLWWALS